jgi:glycosyltransferase involved in cell wall biosynthesis
VTTGWAAEVEVVGDGGVIVPPLHDSYGRPVRYHSRYGMDWAVPDPDAFAEPVLRLLAHKNHRQSLGSLGRLHVQRSFSWDEAAADFIELFVTAKEAAA